MAKYYVRMVAKIEAGSAEEAVQVAEHISDAVTYHDGFDAAGLVSLALDDRSDERLVSEDDDTLAELLRDFTTARDALEDREDDQYLPELEGDLEEAALEVACYVADCTRALQVARFITDCTRLNY